MPGIMGSQLGIRRTPPLPDDIVWIDPVDIQHGRLRLLRVAGPARVVPLGVVLFSYLRLKLQLRARGLAAEFYDYDWRLRPPRSGAPSPSACTATRARGWRSSPTAWVDWSRARRWRIPGTRKSNG